MNWCLIALILFSVICILGLVFIALDDDEEVENFETFSEEDVALAEFLETRQAINEDFLVAQKKLLETLDHERRNF